MRDRPIQGHKVNWSQGGMQNPPGNSHSPCPVAISDDNQRSWAAAADLSWNAG